MIYSSCFAFNLNVSIGSLGKDNSSDHVSNVLVDRARLTGTTNGVRIKTWQVNETCTCVICVAIDLTLSN